jgi:hypothetical protein
MDQRKHQILVEHVECVFKLLSYNVKYVLSTTEYSKTYCINEIAVFSTISGLCVVAFFVLNFGRQTCYVFMFADALLIGLA